MVDRPFCAGFSMIILSVNLISSCEYFAGFIKRNGAKGSDFTNLVIYTFKMFNATRDLL